MFEVLAVVCAAIWIYLIAGRGGFWRADIRDSSNGPAPDVAWPPVAVIIPARNECEVIAGSVKSLLQQDYRGELTIIVVDDDSNDDTGGVAGRAAAGDPRLKVVRTDGPAGGWTGKLWAVQNGIVAAEVFQPKYLLLTDADIEHDRDSLASLVSRAMAGGFVLTSLMAQLRCESLAERVHVPAFIYFFQMLYPFAWVGRAGSSVAAAAGGCMLVRRDALAAIGGVASIRNALIDDCALAVQLKQMGPIWLGLTHRVRSVRPYETFGDVARMISRSAYSQLRYSPLLLAATTLAMAITFIAPPFLAVFARGWAQYLALAAWAVMALSFIPTLRYYGRAVLWSVALPAIALLYMRYTLKSAWQHLRRRGGQWKGRVHGNAPSLQ